MNSSKTYNLESLLMDNEQLASFEPALARFLEKIRHCFKRDKTFGYMQKCKRRSKSVPPGGTKMYHPLTV